MQRLLTLCLLTVLSSPLAHAQLDSTDRNVVNQAAFQLTKATVEFVATDKLTFGNLAKTTCETCTDYASLIQFIKASKLAKADELVRDAQKQVAALTTPTASASQILVGLKQYLHDRATKGDNRERRTKLDSYKTYTTQVARILSSAGVESGTEADLASVPADTTDTGEAIVPETVKKGDTGGLFSIGGLALLLSLLNLAGLVYMWLQRNQKTESPADAQVPELSRRVSLLERERKELLNRLNGLEKNTPSPTNRPVTAPEPRRTEPTVAPKPATAAPTPEPMRPVQATPPTAAQPAPPPTSPVPTPVQPSFQPQAAPANQPRRRETVLYGRTADLGDGFSVASLLETPDRDTVFQIEVRTESQAVYRVTEEPGAQQLALSDPYSYLADACEYTAKPMPNARIRTTQPGQLALQGDKWKIVEKAKISFY